MCDSMVHFKMPTIVDKWNLELVATKGIACGVAQETIECQKDDKTKVVLIFFMLYFCS